VHALCQVELRLALGVGDWVDFLVHPRANMDCDGVYVVDMQLWQDPGDAAPWETR
jgi:hypothetical protein